MIGIFLCTMGFWYISPRAYKLLKVCYKNDDGLGVVVAILILLEVFLATLYVVTRIFGVSNGYYY